MVTIRAWGNLGLYYGLLTFCQIVDKNNSGKLTVPTGKIVDWPAIGLRLAKTSATTNPLATLEKFADWMPLYKMNQIGLQFHGEESRQLGRFQTNVESLCPRERENGLLETIVYFCPFRGEGYDFQKKDDRNAYAKLIHWMLRQGAHGIEVDYNDWPGRDTPIKNVIHLAYEAVQKIDPEAYILYCPPNRGDHKYYGPASSETRRILDQLPEKVCPLWTGTSVLIQSPLSVEDVEEWTQKAGRRPFLWVNRVSREVDRSFSRLIEGMAEARVFQGELLPVELNELFEGIHFNAGFSSGYNTMPENFSKESLVYFATAADYVWNARDWDVAESYERAQRFVSIMKPIVDGTK